MLVIFVFRVYFLSNDVFFYIVREFGFFVCWGGGVRRFICSFILNYGKLFGG